MKTVEGTKKLAVKAKDKLAGPKAGQEEGAAAAAAAAGAEAGKEEAQAPANPEDAAPQPPAPDQGEAAE